MVTNWAKNCRHGHIQIPSRTCIYCSNIFKYIHAYIPFHSIPFHSTPFHSITNMPEGQYVRRINMYIYIYIHASKSLYSSSTLVRHPLRFVPTPGIGGTPSRISSNLLPMNREMNAP